MKSIVRLSLLLVLILPKTILSQTVLIDSLQEGGFSLGNTFELNGWTTVNASGLNKWYVGTVPPGFNGNCAYISNNSGTSWGYHPTSSNFTAHFYRDVVLPQGINYLELNFLWANLGEIAPNDVLMISIAPTSFVPSQTNNSAIVLNPPAQTLAVLHNSSIPLKRKIFFHPQVVNTCSSAASIRLIFSFRYNNSAGSNPPAAVDNISLIAHNSPIGLNGGSYTVDKNSMTAGSNFSTLGSALAAINAASQCPLSDTITLNVLGDQIFNEDLPMITFRGTQSAGLQIKKFGGNENPIVMPIGGSWDKDYGMGLNGAKYVTIDGVDIKVDASNNNIEYGYFIRPSDVSTGSQFNKVVNCKIILNKTNSKSIGLYQTTSSGILGFSPANQDGTNSYNQYKGIKIENVSSGLYLHANNFNLPDKGNELGSTSLSEMIIGGSQINDIGGNFTAYGINFSFQDAVIVNSILVRNIFTSANQAVSGIRFGECTGDIQITKCRILNIFNISAINANAVIGINIIGSGQSPSNININNCFISEISAAYNGNSSSSYVAGIYIAQSNSQSNIYFNSIKVISSGRTNTAALYSSQTSARIKNNILVNKTIGSTNLVSHHSLKFGTGGGIASLNNNCYNYDPSGQNTFMIGSSIGLNFSNLQSWRNYAGFDLNSIDLLPDFISTTDLHIIGNSFKVDKKGTYVPYISKDIDENLRDTIMPDIGADDYVPISSGLDIGIYGVNRINNSGCFSEFEELKLLLTNTSILTHDFSLNPVMVNILVSGSYNASYSFEINTGILTSYQNTYVTVPSTFNFSGGGNIVVTIDLNLTGDVNIYNDEFSAFFNQEIVYGRLTENFNASTSVPGSWKLGAGWTINASNGIYSNGLGKAVQANSVSEFTLPHLGIISASDSLAFGFSVPNLPNWGTIQILVNSNCSSTYIPFDTIFSTSNTNGQNYWNKYLINLAPFEGQIIEIKILVNSNVAGQFLFDNFNTPVCAIPPIPSQLQMVSTGFYSINGSFVSGGADGHLVIRYVHGSIPSSLPLDNKEYLSGELMGNGLIVAAGTSLTFSDSGLLPETLYDYYVYPYFGTICGTGPKYNLTNVLWGSVSTNSCAVSGTLRIGSSNDDFTSISAALSYIGNFGVLDTIILELQSDYNPESKITFSSIICNDSSRILIIRPAGNVVNEINFSRTPGSLGALLSFNGANGIIIDGRPGGNGTNSMISFGILGGTTIELLGASKNITFNYLKIKGYSVIYSLPVINMQGCSNIKWTNNQIGNLDVMSAILINAESNPMFHQISGNRIYNFSQHAIRTSNGTDVSIYDNSFYCTIPNTKSDFNVNTLYIANTSNFQISNNVIGGSLPSGMGSYLTLGNQVPFNNNAGIFIGIRAFGSSAYGSVENNKIKNISIVSANSSCGFYGIYINSDNVVVKNNTIGDPADTTSIKFVFSNLTGEHNAAGIYVNSTNYAANANISISKNYVSNISCFSDFPNHLDFSGLYLGTETSTIVFQIDSNVISNIKNNLYGYGYGVKINNVGYYYPQNLTSKISRNIIKSITCNKGGFCGIYDFDRPCFLQIRENVVSDIICGDTTSSPGNRIAIMGIHTESYSSVFNNLIHNLKFSNESALAAKVVGYNLIGLSGSNYSITFSSNRLYGVSNNSTSNLAEVSAMKTGQGYFNISNNMMDIKMNNSQHAIVRTLYTSCTSINLFNNNFRISDSITADQVSHNVYFDNIVQSATIWGNVLVNKMVGNSSSKKAFCFGISYPIIEKYIALGDNIYDIDLNQGAIFQFPNSTIDDIARYKMYFNKDTTSFICDPDLTNDTTYVRPRPVSRVESAGSTSISPIDFFGYERNNFSPNDIGAVAGNFQSIIPDLSLRANLRYLGCDSVELKCYIRNNGSANYSFDQYPATINILNSSSNFKRQTRAFNITSGILDPFSEDTFLIHLPKIDLGNNSLFISINSAGDGIVYNNTCNLGYNYWGGSGQFSVGKFGDFETLTEAVDFYNKNLCMDGDITFVLIDSLYNHFSETFPISFTRPAQTQSFNLTIKPKRGVNVKIISDLEDVPVFNFLFASHITIDGIDTMGSTTLSIANSSLNTPCVYMKNAKDDIQFKSCIFLGKNVLVDGLFRLDSVYLPAIKINIERCVFGSLEGANVANMFSIGHVSPNAVGILSIRNCKFTDYLSAGFRGYVAKMKFEIVGCYFSSPNLKNTSLSAITVSGGSRVTVSKCTIGLHRTFHYMSLIKASYCDSVFVNNNKVTNQFNYTTSFAEGITVEYAQYTEIKNNFVSLTWTGSQTAWTVGLMCRANYIEIVNSNTVLVSGSYLGSSIVVPFYAQDAQISTSIHNNIFFSQVNSTTSNAVAIKIDKYATTLLNNNVYVGKSTSGCACVLYNNVLYDLASWNSQPFQPDLLSYSFVGGVSGGGLINDYFINSADLHLGNLESVANNAGTALNSLPTDIDGNLRSTSNQDIGADEADGLCQNGFVSTISSYDSLFCSGERKCINSNAAINSNIGLNNHWQYRHSLLDNFVDAAPLSSDEESLCLIMQDKDSLYVRQVSLCTLTGNDTSSNELLLVNQKNVVSTGLDNIYGSLRKIIECSEIYDTIFFESTVDSVFLDDVINIDKSLQIIGNMNPKPVVTHSNSSSLPSFDFLWNIERNKYLYIRDLELFAGNPNFPLIYNSGTLTLYNVLLKNSTNSVLSTTYANTIIDGVVEIR